MDKPEHFQHLESIIQDARDLDHGNMNESIESIMGIINDLDEQDTSSSILAMGIDREAKNDPVKLSSANIDHKDMETMIKVLTKQLPKGIVIGLFHEVFHEMDLRDQDVHETLVWLNNKFNDKTDSMHPKTIEFFKLANNRLN